MIFLAVLKKNKKEALEECPSNEVYMQRFERIYQKRVFSHFPPVLPKFGFQLDFIASIHNIGQCGLFSFKSNELQYALSKFQKCNKGDASSKTDLSYIKISAPS